jgi:hypothetical protein
MNRDKFLNEINRIFRIALIQKMVHLTLRAAWVGGAVYLMCWGTNRIWGWFPNQRFWGLIALCVSLLVIGSIFLVSQLSGKFVWRLDRGFSLQEQVYTLYEVLQEGGPDADKQPGIQELIDSEDIARIPNVRREVVDKGWIVKEEFEATIVVLILLIIVYLTSVSSIVQISSIKTTGVLPVLGVDPSADQIFADGIPGNPGKDETGGIDSSGSEGNGQAGQLDFSPLEWAQVSTLMHELGEDLKDESGTFELGRALVQDDYNEAANQFSRLAENANELTADMQSRIASEFLETAVGFQDIQKSGISNYFQEASAALFGGSNSRISEEMDDLASLMELFSQFQQKEMRADLDPDSIANPSQTLDQYQNNLVVIEEIDDLPDYVSSPGESQTEGSEVLGESLDFIMPFDSNVIEGVWLPFQYSMEDSDVVSSYFSPR